MPRTLLIVDDAETNRLLLKRMLSGEYDILEAADGQTALDVMRREHEGISAVLLDLVMPVLDGFQVLERMRGDAELSRLPVIVTTGHTDEGSEVRALSLGAKDYVAKPYSPAVIRQRIRNTINLRETAAAFNALRRDKLTGLYSREMFFERAEALIRAGEPGSYVLSCFDIENFKVINDQYGNKTGDAVLRAVGELCDRGFRAAGGICGRISADNFAALYPRDFMDSAELQALRAAAENPKGLLTPITFSVGRYVADDPELKADAMYDRASLAKASVKGRYDVHIATYAEPMRQRLLRQQEITGEMKRALENRHFEVWLQPQYNHSTGALVGSEALVRWRHPQRGLVSPGEFIPVFERSGFIYELDKYVWEQACALLRRWLDEGRSPLPVSVNVSRYDIFRDDMIETVEALTSRYRIPVELLRLEITESAFAQSTAQIVSVVRELSQRGFTIEIDDFGSGYSSLNTLKDVPANVLKLDMRFLENDEHSQRGGNILESVVRMAKWLDMAVIAEGVETREQADFLKSIGCSYIQGYYYARPMPVADYEALAASAGREERLLKLETLENLDNNAFWDPRSMDTLIFNSYIGGACIFEYHKGRVELLRANDKYVQVLGSPDMTVEDALRLDWSEHLDEVNLAILRDALAASIRSGDEMTRELVFLELPGCPRETYLRTTIRVIASSGDSHLVYCTNENITAQRLAERKESASAQQLQTIMDNVSSGITAAIISNGDVHLLIANDRYYDILGYTRRQYETEVRNAYDIIYPEDRWRVYRTSAEADRSHVPAQVEYRILRRDGRERWVRAALTATCFAGVDEPVQLSICTDITEEKLAERELREIDEQIRFLNDAAHELLAQPDCDRGIEDALWKLLDYFEGGRAYVFEFDYDKSVTTNTYEVCADGVTPQIERLRDVPLDVMPFWLHAFDRKNCMDIRDVAALDDSRPEKQILLEQGIGSLVAVPLRREGRLLGFMGIDDPRRQQARVSRLEALGDYVAVMLTRRDLNARIISDREALVSLMNDTPGGFVRMRMTAGGGVVPMYFNRGFCGLVGMEVDELMELYGGDAMAGVHPEDVAVVRGAVERMLTRGEASSERYRLRHGGGGYVWVRFFGRTVRSADGETCLNIYYTDVSEQDRQEEQRRELLDNLPCGAALYELAEGELTAVHLNRRYRELVGRELADLADVSPLATVHPDDREPLMAELALAVREGRDAECSLRVLYGHGGEYRPFRVVGRVITRDGDRHAVYASYTPVMEQSASYQEMLPVALAAVMNSAGEISFVKDRNLRYICCSHAFAELAGISDVRDVVGKTDFDLVDASLAEKYRASDREIIGSGQAQLGYDESIPTGDGGTVYASTSKYPLMDASGGVMGIYGVGRDVGEYRTAFERLRLLTDAIPGGIASFELSEGALRLVYFNEGFFSFSGYSREEYAQRSAEDPMFLIFDRDRPILCAALDGVRRGADGIDDCTFRCHTRDGGRRWMTLSATVSSRRGDVCVLNTVQLDVTERREADERLRMSEEQFRIASALSGRNVARFDLNTGTYYNESDLLLEQGFGRVIEDAPDCFIRAGSVSPESRADFEEFFAKLRAGAESATATVYLRAGGGAFRWFHMEAAGIRDGDGRPSQAIIVLMDVTDEREKEAVYRKWQQSLSDKALDSYTLFRCNLSRNASFDSVEGSLLQIQFGEEAATFDMRTREYVDKFVLPDDREAYLDALNCDKLLAGYYRGRRSHVMEYREVVSTGRWRWLRLTIELVEYPRSTEVEAYLMYEDIDKSKRAELRTLAMAETDPLTGVLNRSAFADRLNALMARRQGGALHALLMFDLDGFKLVNDSFGHAVGDQALVDIAGTLRSVLRQGDLVGRLGGDEFLISLGNMPSRALIARKARQICNLVRRSFSIEVQMSASLGIAVCPDDGADFDELYRKADIALYHVKGTGKDSYAFYQQEMRGEDPLPESGMPGPAAPSGSREELKRRMLVVEDNRINRDILVEIFKDEFLVDTAEDGAAALIKLRRGGAGISVVLLDLIMPGMDGFQVLEKMQSSPEMQSIPVVVVSGADEYETNLRAVRGGAADFITKPVDAGLIRLRVRSAVSKAENERLRAQNRYLALQGNEVARCRAVLESDGTVVCEYDRALGAFFYDTALENYISAVFDDRPLWELLTADGAAEAGDAGRVRALVEEVASDASRTCGSLRLPLVTPSGEKHTFRLRVIKRVDEYQLGDRLILTLTDTEMDLEPGDA